MHIFSAHSYTINYSSSNFYEVLHEFLSDVITNSTNGNKHVNPRIEIYLSNPTNSKKYPMLIDSLFIDRNLILKSMNRKVSYNLKESCCVHDLCVFYKNDIYYMDYLYEVSINSLMVTKKTQPITKTEKTEETFVNISDIIGDIHKLSESVTNNNPTIEKVLFPEEELLLLQKEIEKIESYKETLGSTIDDLTKTIDEEQQNLSKYACLVRDQETELRQEENKDKEEYNIFISGKEYTYQKIFNHFFVRKIIKSWDDLPALFVAKFPIYLYLDGRNVEGVPHHSRILDTDDEFRMFKMLYSSITDDEFVMPDDERDAEIVSNFINTLPPIQIITADDVMYALNDPDDELFEQDGTSQCSEDE
jgi:hypothetical protein